MVLRRPCMGGDFVVGMGQGVRQLFKVRLVCGSSSRNSTVGCAIAVRVGNWAVG